jgi:hypothetical protein
MTMNRRDFLIGTAAATAMAGVTTARAQNRADDKKARIAIMMFGLNSIVKNNMPESPARTLDIMDIGELSADKFGVHNVELQSNYFPSTEMSWLKNFKSKLSRTKTKVVQINLEFGAGYNMSAETGTQRLQMIDLHRVWLDKAAFLECPRVLLNQGQPSPANKELTISNYKAVAEIAKTKGIMAASENRGGGGRGRAAGAAGAPGQPAGQAGTSPAAPPAAPPAPATPAAPSYILLTEVLKASGAYSCVDFLNFPNQQEQLEGIRALLPITSGLVHAGMVYDLPAAMKLCREAGYKGLYSIKASGQQGPDPIENTQKILDGLLATM